MRIIAIDPSLSETGLACLDTTNLEEPIWQVGSAKGRRFGTGPLNEYLRMEDLAVAILTWVFDALSGYQPDLVLIEGPAFSKNMGMAHERAGLWWSIFGAMADYGSPIHTPPPIVVVLPNLRAKYATGKANANKDTVMLAVSRRYPTAALRNNNEADAVCIAAMGARLLGEPVDALPQTHVAALKTITLPEVIR
jgi:Holliday junction resolvasome RuvABC endonuclease subunit